MGPVTGVLAAKRSKSLVNIDPRLVRYIGNTTYALQDMVKYCKSLPDLYGGISEDLRHWKGSGITKEAYQLSAESFTTFGGSKAGVALAFYGGKAYVVDRVRLQGLGHQVNVLFTYMLVMLDLQRQFGELIPDVEFVLASSDRPMVLLSEIKKGQPIPPLLRFCSSPDHADIRIPTYVNSEASMCESACCPHFHLCIQHTTLENEKSCVYYLHTVLFANYCSFHFYTKKYQQKLLDHIPEINSKYPWKSKKHSLFGVFSTYYRHVHPKAASTARRGAAGTSICSQVTLGLSHCSVRKHGIAWAANVTRAEPNRNIPLIVRSNGPIPLPDLAQFKYLLHLDGQSVSSRVEQLMALNSVMFKEESGYSTFYYHLLKPYVNYVPVWKEGPEDILEALEWTYKNDDKARDIARNAQVCVNVWCTGTCAEGPLCACGMMLHAAQP